MRKYGNTIIEIIKNILWDWRKLLLFEFLYKILGGVLLFPYVSSLFQESIEKAHIVYIDMETIGLWLKEPFTLLILPCTIILVGLYVFYEISVLAHYFHFAQQRKAIKFFPLIVQSLKKTLRIMYPRNWFVLIIVLLLFPLTALSLTPVSLMQVRIPEYFVDFFKERGILYNIYIITLILINILLFYMLYMLPIFLLEDHSFFQASKKSIRYMKKKFFKTFLSYLLWLAGILAIFLFLCGIILLMIVVRYSFLADTESSISRFMLTYIQFKQYAAFLFEIVFYTGSFSIVMYKYHKISDVDIHVPYVKKKRSKKIYFISSIEIVCMLIAIGIYNDYQGNAFYKIGIIEKPIDIIAHRAGTIFAPENTVPALRYAIEVRAAYAEIDVQQSKDGELYILHDTNFKRTTGVDKNIWEVSSEEIDTYDAGSHFSPEFKETKVPTLEQMIKVADGKIKLMIELKKNENDKNLEEDTVALIKKYKFEQSCVIASMDLQILKTVKRLDPSIQTVYIAPVLYGDFYELEDIDMFSVEATFINKHMISALHNADKKIFAWTINKDSELKRLTAMDIDGVVTDNPELASYYKNIGGRDEFINGILKWLFPKQMEDDNGRLLE